MTLNKIVVGNLEVNCYILSTKSNKAIIIDPGEDFLKIDNFIKKKKLEPVFIINTHGHIDHIGADENFKLPVYIHSRDAEYLSNAGKNLSSFLGSPYSFNAQIKSLEDKDNIKLEELSLDVIHTPGHTPGGICLKCDDFIFTGDTLFREGIGRTDFPGASSQDLLQSINKKLLVFPDEVKIYPGHGPDSTIGHERKYNQFLK